MFKKILIANRGEIACRVIRTVKKLNITAVAVYSDADRAAEHIKQADEAYYLGESPANQSYLCIDKIIAIAKAAQVDAIHPGYGFLAENAEFAAACAKAGIVFIGPPVKAIEAMGSKAAAKALMAQHGVPVLSGYHSDNQNEAVLLKAAKEIGFPVLIKASFGGGGRGMRIVNSVEEFPQALATAKREALNGFGNDHVIIEKYLANPRHVEVQVFADRQQNYCYLFERDCSIQRRHQKVVEEAPAPHVDEALRKKLGEAAVQAARAIQYEGAGTIEFLLGEDQQFYFMEMNTRLQVEHPVTEMITGEDLVAWQIQIAQGMPLPKTQAELKLHGAAMEVRLCAEDPQNQFLPATGFIDLFDYPSFVRVDTGYRAGDSVSIYYDSLLAKIIAFGENREEARRALLAALDHTQVLGVKTNRTLLANILQQDDFINAHLSTAFIATHEKALLTNPAVAPDEVFVALSLLRIMQLTTPAASQVDPWLSLTAAQFTFEFEYSEQKKILLCQKSARGWQVQCDKNIFYNCSLLSFEQHTLRVLLDQAIVSLEVWPNGAQYAVHFAAQSYTVRQLPRFGEQQVDAAADSQLTAPMPGRIIAENVKVGDKVKAGQVLLMMEAMKMEHAIRAPFDGTVQALHCKLGDIVTEGMQLAEITDAVVL